jgi:uncharacterized protein (DUF2235 family)
MPKNIVICSDGTGNTAIKGRGTNVFKLFEAVDLTSHRTDPRRDPQIALYDDGVGTEGFTLLRLLGGAAGFGLSRNVRDLYRELSRVYDPGDQIFLFGFSRGAFTVRTLGGLIGACGLIRGEEVAGARLLRQAVCDAYAAYRAGYHSLLTRVVDAVLRRPARGEAVRRFQARWPVHTTVPIQFVGVWDTVDAVGMPFALAEFINRTIVQFKFPTQTLGPHVRRACHALSLEDRRTAFAPVMWTVPAAGDRRVEQVWFAGVHANVGGGYPKHGMSLVALDWMLNRAQEAGLRLHTVDREDFAMHANADDKLYDSRAGLGIFYRWRPRDVRRYCANNNVEPEVHVSVLERVAHGTDGYAPGNIPLASSVAITRSGDAERDEAMRTRADAVQDVLRNMLSSTGYLLEPVRSTIRVGELSYWLFVMSWLGLLGSAVIATRDPLAPVTLGALLGGVWTVVADLVALRLGSVWATFATIWRSPYRTGFVASVAGFIVATFLQRHADRTLNNCFTSAWHHWQPKLRTALKLARAEARAAQAPGRRPE